MKGCGLKIMNDYGLISTWCLLSYGSAGRSGAVELETYTMTFRMEKKRGATRAGTADFVNENVPKTQS